MEFGSGDQQSQSGCQPVDATANQRGLLSSGLHQQGRSITD